MMTGEEAAAAVVKALEDLQIPYVMVGSFASNVYGIVRSTQDADFVVQLGETPVSALTALLGSEFVLDPQMSFETVTGTTRFILQLAGTPFKIEVFLLSDDPHDQERFRRRVRVSTQLGSPFLLTPEDVIITKARWVVQARRRKDEEDVRNVVAVQGDAIDWEYVYRWCDQHGSRQFLDEIRRSLPPV